MKIKTLILTALATIGMTIATLAQNVPSYVPANGLVGWWPFAGNANDESGNGNNGLVNGATLTSDRFGNSNQAYNFDGIQNNIGIGNNFTFSSFSISSWVNPSLNSSFCDPCHVVVSKINNANQPVNFELRGPNAGLIGDGSTFNALYFNSNELALGVWFNIVIIYDSASQTEKLFLNGIQKDSLTNIAFNNIANDSVCIGARPTSNSLPWEGKLDDIGIWNRALSQQEITDLYNSCQLSVNAQPINDTIYINNNTQFIVGAADTSASYQWQTDLGFGLQNLNSGGQYSGTANDTLIVSNVNMNNNNQPFRCVVTSGSCSDTSAFALLTVNNNVGMNDLSQDNLFSVFPNPAQRVINVKADIGLIGSVYMVYNHIGKAFLTGKLSAEITTIDLGNLPAGIYLVKVGKNLTKTFKVTKE